MGSDILMCHKILYFVFFFNHLNMENTFLVYEIHVFLEFSCFSFDPMDAGNLISGSSPFVKFSLNIWKTLYSDKLHGGGE